MLMKQMFNYDTCIMHRLDVFLTKMMRHLQLQFAQGALMLPGDEIFIFVEETWGRRCDINTVDAALQFMSCTRVTGLSLSLLKALLFSVCQCTQMPSVHKVIFQQI